jgi:hypothetical protein
MTEAYKLIIDSRYLYYTKRVLENGEYKYKEYGTDKTIPHGGGRDCTIKKCELNYYWVRDITGKEYFIEDPRPLGEIEDYAESGNSFLYSYEVEVGNLHLERYKGKAMKEILTDDKYFESLRRRKLMLRVDYIVSIAEVV